MEFESRIAGSATGILLLGSYIMLFGIGEYSSFLVTISLLLLLLVAFRDHKLGKWDLISFVMAMSISIFFLKYLANSTYLPLAVTLIVCLVAINARIETFLPSIAGLLVLQFLNTEFLLKWLNDAFMIISPLPGLRYEINDVGYLMIYHSRNHLPILIDEVKLFLPFFISLMVAQLVLLAILVADRKRLIRSAPAIMGITFLFIVLTFQKFLSNPSVSDFIPENMLTLIIPLASILLISIVIPEARIKKIQGGSLTSKKITASLLIAFFILGLLYYTPLVARSDPVIIIDESHSEWEPTWTDYLKTYEKDPVSGSNNYFGLLNILCSLYDVTLIIDKPEKAPAVSGVNSALIKEISFDALEKISSGRKAVLVLKCITTPFKKSEVDAIMRFIAQGNGLLLISEHTDIYGMCTNINPIAELTGYRFLATGVQDVYTDSRGSITQRGEFPPLIARYMTGDQVWETSDSLEKLDGRNTLFDIITRPSYFSHYRNETSAFFLTREFTDEVKMNSLFARHLIMAGTRYGEGKVVLFTDSTDFNNGVIGFGNHAQLFIGMIEYASSVDKFNNTWILLFLSTIALLVFALNRRNVLRTLVIVFILLLISYNLSYPIAHYTTQFPELKTEPKMIGIKANENYFDDYLSGSLDLEKIMDRYFKQNLTAVIIEEPSEDWFRISKGMHNLSDVMVS